MKYLLQVVLSCLLLLQVGHAAENTVNFDQESYVQQYKNTTPTGDKVVEFVRENETIETWSKMVAYRYQQLPGLENNPEMMAKAMAGFLKKSNPDARYQVMSNKKKGDALIDFITWDDQDDYVEFNVFRYVKSVDGKAIVSLQVAYRFTDTSAEQIKKLNTLRASWIEKTLAFDMALLHAKLAL